VCLIVDADAASKFLGRLGPVRDWLRGDRGSPRLVADGLLRQQLAIIRDVRRLLVELEREGKLRSAGPSLAKVERDLRRSRLCQSNDYNVLALAILTGARTLATFDNALARDFRNLALIRKPRGSIYRRPTEHGHLLEDTPESCGVPLTKRR
jgi:predicted nucleic acid-binding protein